MFFDPEVDVAMNSLRKDCKLVYTGGGHYNVISPRSILGYKKIADIDVDFNRNKICIHNLRESIYGFQKDELLDEAATDWLRRNRYHE